MRRVAIFAGLLTLASISLAQSGQVIQPTKVETGIKNKPISTYSFTQQIVNVKGQINKEVENEIGPPPIPPAETNSLPVGAINSTPLTGTMNANFPGIDATGWVPADPDLAVGPTHCVNVVNVAIAFFKKDGTKTFQQVLDGTGFFQGVATAGFVFDPKCFYDPVSKRFFVVALELDQTALISGLLIAVSDDSDPTGTWNRYRIDSKQTVNGNDYWLDYPGFGFNKDAIMLTGNMFGFTSGFNGIQFFVVRKAELLTGAAATVTKFTQGGGSAQVMRTGNDPNASVLYGMNFASTSAARLYAIQNAATNPTMVTADVTIPTWNGPTRGGISVNDHELDSLDGRVFNLHYRAGHLYAAHGIRASGSDDRCVSRWYDISLNNWPVSGTPSYSQGGNIGVAGQDYILPAICPNGGGEIAVVSTRCSSSIVADFVINARRSGDAAGTMRPAVRLAGSIGSQYGGSSNRWGDYFGLQVDPNDDRTFWGVGMIANSGGGWITTINSFRLTTPFSDTPDSIARFEGASSSGTVTNVLNSDNSYFNVNSVSVLRTGHVASAVAEFTLPGSTFELNATVEARAISGVTGSLFFYDWTTSQYVFVNSSPLTGADSTKTYGAGVNYSKYINSQGKVRILYRGVYPARVGSSPLAFQLKIDKISLGGSN